MKLRQMLTATAIALASSASFAAPVATFLIEGDTFTQAFKISNLSTGGEHITRIAFDIAPSGMVFDTVDGGVPNDSTGRDFTPVASTAAATGFIPGSATDPALADGSSLLEMFFNSDSAIGETFDNGEFFSWNVDIDPADRQGDVTVFGDQLAGSVVTIDFDSGLRLTGTMTAVVGSRASQLRVSSVDPIPGTNPTPEPGSLALAGLALLAAGALRRGKSA